METEAIGGIKVKQIWRDRVSDNLQSDNQKTILLEVAVMVPYELSRFQLDSS